jgi:hypothetical protein
MHVACILTPLKNNAPYFKKRGNKAELIVIEAGGGIKMLRKGILKYTIKLVLP